MLFFGSATNLVFFALLCYLSVRSAAPELRRGQHGAGLPRWQSRAGGHGAGTELDFQGGRSRAGGYGAVSTELDFQGGRSRAGGYGAVSTELDFQGEVPELAATARSTGRGPDKPKNWRATDPRKWRGQTNPRTGGHTLHPMWWGSGG